MQNFLRLTSGLPVMPLLAAIRRKPEIWKADTYLRNYPQGPFGEVESIILRFPPVTVYELEDDAKKHLSDRRYDPHECVDRLEYKVLHEARPLVMNLMAFVQGERLGRVMINKIAPGGRIFPHADTEEHASYWTRHHIVLQGMPGCAIRCGDEQMEFRSGDCFWFNNKIEHEVLNNSADDRISMVVDIRTSQ
jgi:mannose-6-phosphate isomerase-like protein (cupin superfamily)